MQKGAMSTVHRFIILNLDHSRSVHKMVQLLPRSKSDTSGGEPWMSAGGAACHCRNLGFRISSGDSHTSSHDLPQQQLQGWVLGTQPWLLNIQPWRGSENMVQECSRHFLDLFGKSQNDPNTKHFKIFKASLPAFTSLPAFCRRPEPCSEQRAKCTTGSCDAGKQLVLRQLLWIAWLVADC